MDWDFTIYWKELMTEMIAVMRSLLAKESFYEVFHPDMQAALYSGLAFCNDIDNLLLLDRSLGFDQIYLLLYGLYGQVNHINKMAGIMINPALTAMFENKVLDEQERLQVTQIKVTGKKLFFMIGRVKDYFKLLSLKPDDLDFEDTDLHAILKGVTMTLAACSRGVTIEVLDDPIVTFTDSRSVRSILLNLCTGWLSEMPDVWVYLTVSKDQESQMAKLVFAYDKLAITMDELKTKLVPSLALENNTLDLVITTQLIQQQNGRFESRLDGQQLMFTMWLPLAKIDSLQ
jgi:hypothetical protein